MLDPKFEYFLAIGIPQRTVYRWKRNRRCPMLADLVWQWFQDGEPFSGSQDWHGWRFFCDELWSPEGDSFTPADLRAWAFHRRNGACLTRGKCHDRENPSTARLTPAARPTDRPTADPAGVS